MSSASETVIYLFILFYFYCKTPPGPKTLVEGGAPCRVSFPGCPCSVPILIVVLVYLSSEAVSKVLLGGHLWALTLPGELRAMFACDLADRMNKGFPLLTGAARRRKEITWYLP